VLVPVARRLCCHCVLDVYVSTQVKPEYIEGIIKGMALPDFTMRQLLEAGVHFGHKTHRWNPKMAPYIFGKRNDIHIINLAETVPLLHQALVAISDTVASGGRVLFVGTKRQASDTISEYAGRSAQYYMNHRWLGGTLTNWKTITNSIRRLRKLENMFTQENTGLTKKELLQLTREHDKLEQAFGGIKDMGEVPDILFVIDTNREALAIAEARKLSIPIVAVIDSNSNPDGIDYPFPGNDDSSRAIELYCDLVAKAVIDGIERAQVSSGVDIGASEQPIAEASTVGKSATSESKPAGKTKPKKDKAGKNKKPATKADDTTGKAAGKATKTKTEGTISTALIKELREKSGAGMMDCKKALTEAAGDIEAAVDWLRTKGLAKAAKKSGRIAAEGLVGMHVAGNMGVVVELNSETDFVARNEEFQKMVTNITETALSADGDLDRLLEATYPGSDKTVADFVREMVGTIGENMNVRRTSALEVKDGVVASYMHNATAPGLGKIAVLVGLESKGDAEKLTEFGRKVAMHIAASTPLALNEDELDPAVVEKERDVLSEQARESGKPENVIEKMIVGRMKKFFEEVVLLSQKFVIDPDITVDAARKAAEKDIGAQIKITGFTRIALGEGLEKREEDFAAEVAAAASGS
jgi:elongation factor Ts